MTEDNGRHVINGPDSTGEEDDADQELYEQLLDAVDAEEQPTKEEQFRRLLGNKQRRQRGHRMYRLSGQ